MTLYLDSITGLAETDIAESDRQFGKVHAGWTGSVERMPSVK